MAFQLLLAGLCFRPLWELFEFSWNHDYCTYIVLVPVVSAWLLFLKRPEIRAALESGGRAGSRRGWVLVGLGFATCFCAFGLRGVLDHNDYLSVATLGAVLAWAGGFLAFFGRDAFRSALFPIAFLIFMVPIPSVILDGMIYGLRIGSTWAAQAWFDILGLPIDSEGFVFNLPNTSVEVARQCSGIRSCIALCLTGLLFAHLFFDSVWANAAAFLLAIPVSVIKNGLRIMVLGGSLNEWGDNWYTHTLHRKGGIVFFALALTVLIALLLMMRMFASFLNVKRSPPAVEKALEDPH